MTILMLGSFVSEMRYTISRECYVSFFRVNQKAIMLYLLISFFIVFLSQTVPIGYQLRRLFDEIVMLLFIMQTYFLTKNDNEASKVLLRIICGVLLFNIIYCVYFEVILRINPAGMPLYILMGVNDSDFIVDMIESERGGLDFRAQTVYGHPLSLGQYLLVMMPLFLIDGKRRANFLILIIICSLIVLSGSRGAIAPMALVLLLGYRVSFRKHAPKVLLALLTLLLLGAFLSDRAVKKVNREIEPFVASLQFWDDKKQYKSGIGGSSMEMRIDQFEAAQNEISANPIMGRGYGYREYWQNKHNGLHPNLLGYESVLIYYLVERGWLGLFFFFVMIFYMYKIYSAETRNVMALKLIFLGYLSSIIMTGVRPLTLLLVCLSCSIVCGIKPFYEESIEEDSSNLNL